jgi:tetratricopeptide (TPR) repeat protein
MTLKKNIKFLVCIWLMMGSHAIAAVNLTKLVNEIRPAVVTIIVYDINHQIANIGSGFFIDAKGHLITNYHVLDGKYAADVRISTGDTYPIKLVVADNKAVDLVKVLVDIPPKKIKWIKVSSEMPALAEQVIVVGSPMGLEQTVSEGIVSSIREIPLVGEFFQMSAPISPGSSGSPVVNLQGQVVGVATFQLISGQNLNFAVAGSSVAKLKATKAGQAMSLWTFNNSLRQPKLAEELCRKGYSFSINGEDQKALKFFQEATAKDPSNTMAWNGLGYCQAGMNNHAGAIDAYRQGIHINPDNAELYFNLGNYYTKLGQYKEAIEAFNQVVRLKPEFEAAHFKLGLIYSELGKLDEEKAAFETVIRLNPAAIPAHYNIGIVYAKLGRYEEAIKAHQEILRLNPEFAPAHNHLGMLFGKLGRPKEAMDAYKNAIRIDPEYAPAHYNLGYAMYLAGDKAAALDEYKILKKLDPAAAEQLFSLIYR